MTRTPPLAIAATETIQRTVRGTVMAANPSVDPQTIVVKVTLSNTQKLIVGAREQTGTQITRGTKTTQLADLNGSGTDDVLTDSCSKLVQDRTVENKL